MVCPHCRQAFHDSWTEHGSHRPRQGGDRLQLETTVCPACDDYIVRLRLWRNEGSHEVNFANRVIYPGRVPREVAEEVPDPFASDFREASLVLGDSPKASAAVSRRLVQHIIREKAGIRRANLSDEIDALIESDALPADLAHDLDALRTVGNFAAHPIKSTNTGEVVDVEPGEAEWLLDLLDELLEFYFVRPTRRTAKREALNVKLEGAGKPPLKGSDSQEDGG